MFDAMSDWMTVPLLHYDYAGTVWPRVGLGHPTIAPYGGYAVGGALGAEQTLIIGVQNDVEWQRFSTEVLKRPDLSQREEFRTNMRRVENRKALDSEILGVLAKMTVEALRTALTDAK